MSVCEIQRINYCASSWGSVKNPVTDARDVIDEINQTRNSIVLTMAEEYFFGQNDDNLTELEELNKSLTSRFKDLKGAIVILDYMSDNGNLGACQIARINEVFSGISDLNWNFTVKMQGVATSDLLCVQKKGCEKYGRAYHEMVLQSIRLSNEINFILVNSARQIWQHEAANLRKKIEKTENLAEKKQLLLDFIFVFNASLLSYTIENDHSNFKKLSKTKEIITKIITESDLENDDDVKFSIAGLNQDFDDFLKERPAESPDIVDNQTGSPSSKGGNPKTMFRDSLT